MNFFYFLEVFCDLIVQRFSLRIMNLPQSKNKNADYLNVTVAKQTKVGFKEQWKIYSAQATPFPRPQPTK
jgi:hypothetical protein